MPRLDVADVCVCVSPCAVRFADLSNDEVRACVREREGAVVLIGTIELTVHHSRREVGKVWRPRCVCQSQSPDLAAACRSSQDLRINRCVSSQGAAAFAVATEPCPLGPFVCAAPPSATRSITPSLKSEGMRRRACSSGRGQCAPDLGGGGRVCTGALSLSLGRLGLESARSGLSLYPASNKGLPSLPPLPFLNKQKDNYLVAHSLWEQTRWPTAILTE